MIEADVGSAVAAAAAAVIAMVAIEFKRACASRDLDPQVNLLEVSASCRTSTRIET